VLASSATTVETQPRVISPSDCRALRRISVKTRHLRDFDWDSDGRCTIRRRHVQQHSAGHHELWGFLRLSNNRTLWNTTDTLQLHQPAMRMRLRLHVDRSVELRRRCHL